MKQIITLILSLCLITITSHAQVLYGTTYDGGKYGGGVINSYERSISTYNVTKSFSVDGEDPDQNLIRASNGKLYGTAADGGAFDYGTIFSYDPASGNYTTLYSFDYYTVGGYPYGSLFQASDGKLYGMTYEGGNNEYGTIFSFDPSTAAVTDVHDFDYTDGAYPYGNNLVQAQNGKLYGMTYAGGADNDGVIFSFDPVTNGYSKLLDFDQTNGAEPYGSLTPDSLNGKLYGMTVVGGANSEGVIFSFDPSVNTYTDLYDFDNSNNNGAYPYGSLTLAQDNKLYGMAYEGGANNEGVIFSFDPAAATNAYNDLHDFAGTDGSYPDGNDLIQAQDSKLYGMTYDGGANNEGVVFSFDPAGNTYTDLHDFDDSDGEFPYGSLLQMPDGTLYGTTYDGGTAYDGVLFSYNISASSFNLIRSFNTNYEGAYLLSGLYKASDGNLYGTTYGQGKYDEGTLFSYNPLTDSLVKLVDFNSDSGYYSYGPPVQASNGKLYGLLDEGGTNNYGALYSYDLTDSVYTILYKFDGTNGAYPVGSLVLDTADGKFYGNAYAGGANNVGVIFSFDPATNTYTDVHDHDGSTGQYPYNSLLLAQDGKLYGTTFEGGANSYGVIFSFDPSAVSNGYSDLHDCDYSTGSEPLDNLIQASDGKLYGTMEEGGANLDGVIFSFDPAAASNGYTDLHDFDYTNGEYPFGGLGQAQDGKLYGLAYEGGAFDSGVVYSYDPLAVSDNFQKIKDLNYNSGGYPEYGSFTVVACNNPKTFYKDVDGDSYGDPNNSISISCTPPAGYVRNNLDCDDSDATIHPGAPELCDGKDNNCNGQVDEGCPVPKFKIYDASIKEGNKGEKQMKFKVTLSDSAYRTITVNYRTVNNTATAPSDYEASSGTLTFNKGDKHQYITVLINGDKQVEPDETFKVKLSDAVNATLKDSVAVGTILNDDHRTGMLTDGISSDDSKAMLVSPNPASSLVTIHLNGYGHKASIQLTSPQGKLLRTIETQGNATQQLNVSDLASGTYFISITDEDGSRQTAKLVITR